MALIPEPTAALPSSHQAPSQINVRVARDALVNEVDESDAVAHLGDGRDVADSQHSGVIDEFLYG